MVIKSCKASIMNNAVLLNGVSATVKVQEIASTQQIPAILRNVTLLRSVDIQHSMTMLIRYHFVIYFGFI